MPQFPFIAESAGGVTRNMLLMLLVTALIEVPPPITTAAPVYRIVPLGLTGAAYTRNDGYRFSSAGELNEAGQVIGYSQRYDDDGSGVSNYNAWLYDGTNTIDIGLAGPEHTSSSGYRTSNAEQLNQAGQVRGYSFRYDTGGTEMGQSAWYHDSGTTIDIGFTGPEHTRSDGYKYSYTNLMNEAGQVIGASSRYNGGRTLLGLSAWLYDGGTTIDIGLTGPEHTRSDGYKSSSAGDLNEAGQVSGHSRRYDSGGTDLGLSEWLYDGGTTFDIGLTDVEHTRSDGYRSSESHHLSESGKVIGFSERFNGTGAKLGSSAWLYDGQTTINLGFTGHEHTRIDGYKSSSAAQLNEAGQVIGSSGRYFGSSDDYGRTAWFYDGQTTIDIGLTGPEHTRNNGYKYSAVGQLNEAGQAIGISDRFDGGGADMGRSAWLYDLETTIDIGLTGPDYTRNDGYRHSYGQQLNEAGQVCGSSDRYNGGSTALGRSVWLYDGTATVDIGLTNSEHSRDDGYQLSVARELNEAGQVSGSSERYNGGGTLLGQDAWLYDPGLNQTFALRLSTRSDGYAYSSAAYLGDDGLLLGTYTLFDALDNNLGARAFYFTIWGCSSMGTLRPTDGTGWPTPLAQMA